MQPMPAVYPVILAGGASSRLWPLSDHRRPKWDLRLLGDESLLQMAWARARAVAPAAHGFVVAGDIHERPIRESLPDLPRDHLLIEPVLRDTAAAVAFAAARVQQIDPNGVLLVLPGDQVIRPLARFKECVEVAARAAVQHLALVTFGIVAKHPATGYGYVQRGAPLEVTGAAAGAPQAFEVLAFKEKPDEATARKYLESGAYYWNGGIFAFPLPALLENFAAQLPGHGDMVKRLAATATREQWNEAAKHCYPELRKTSIDFGIMEHAKRVATVAADFEWDDIGSWSAIRGQLGAKDSANATGPNVQLEAINATDNVVFARGRRVALIGVNHLAIVEDREGLLVADLAHDQLVKEIAQRKPAVAFSELQAPSAGRSIDVLIAEPRRLSAETGFMLVLHGHGNSRMQYKDAMERWAARYNLICISPEYRGSGLDANPETGKGTVEPYDFNHLQALDALNALRAAHLKYTQADTRRTFAWGGSQGGHMATLCAAFAPGTFALCINACGPAYVRPENVARLAEPAGEAGMAIRDARRWVSRISCPVVLFHGTADPTVPDSHMRELAQALNAAGKDTIVRFIHGGDHFLRPVTTRQEQTELLADDLLRHQRRDTEDDFELRSSYDFPCPGGVVFRLDFSSGLALFSKREGHA